MCQLSLCVQRNYRIMQTHTAHLPGSSVHCMPWDRCSGRCPDRQCRCLRSCRAESRTRSSHTRRIHRKNPDDNGKQICRCHRCKTRYWGTSWEEEEKENSTLKSTDAEICIDSYSGRTYWETAYLGSRVDRALTFQYTRGCCFHTVCR